MTTYKAFVSQISKKLLNVDASQRLSRASLLIRLVSGYSPSLLLLNYPEEIDISLQTHVLSWVSSLNKGVPFSYLVNHDLFKGRCFYVNEGTLIPRPETELLVDTITTYINQSDYHSFSCLELGVGSGIISLSLAQEFPEGQFFGWELSPSAYVVAIANQMAFSLANITFYQDDFFEKTKLESTTALLHSNFPVIFVSNPPYVAHSEDLDTSVREFEPSLALLAEESGLLYYRRLFELKLTCPLFFEIGIHQEAPLSELLNYYSYTTYFFKYDYQNIARVLVVNLDPF